MRSAECGMRSESNSSARPHSALRTLTSPCPTSCNTPDDQRAMLAAIGAASLEELFADGARRSCGLQRPLDVPPALSRAGADAAPAAAGRARTARPATEGLLPRRRQLRPFHPGRRRRRRRRAASSTPSYTPYQAEASQGNLQAIFEYQTLICQLTGMDVSNASLYDGGSAGGRGGADGHAAPRGGRGKRRAPRACIPSTAQIARHLPREPRRRAGHRRRRPTGIVDAGRPRRRPSTTRHGLRPRAAPELLRLPRRRRGASAKIAHDAGALFVVSRSIPISLGLLKRPGDYGADIAVAEGQSLGTPLRYGGPYLGIMACREQFVRRMPGRLAGQTVDRRGKRCWVLTLQTREQHIRREKATSNICTNQGLFALRASGLPGRAGPAGAARRRPSCACARRTTPPSS